MSAQGIAGARGLAYYKVPLYDSAFAELALPYDLTYEDSIRLSAFVFALVADPETPEAGSSA